MREGPDARAGLGHGGGRSGPAGRFPWVFLSRGCGLVFGPAVVACALVGALTTPPYLTLIIAPACGFSVGNAVLVLLEGFPGGAWVRRGALLSGAWTGLLVLTLPGADALGVDGSGLVLVLVVLGAVTAVTWIGEARASCAEGGGPGTDEQLRQLLGVLPTAVLFREWRETGEQLQSGADLDRRAEAVEVRNLLLEEFSRRDPVGVGRWLSEGDEELPEQYLRDDRRASP
ncbi:hypothetical protein ACI784_20815 [Geodermatophilus sp. SYSU D01186]